MKKTTNRAAFSYLRALLAISLSLAAVVLAGTAFTGLTVPTAAEGEANAPSGVMKLAMKRIHAGLARKQTANARGAAAKASTDAASTGSAKASPAASSVSLPAPPIAQTKNDLGQTVYTVSPSGFDVSPPLTELAKTPEIADTEGDHGELDELKLPPWRTLRSSERDPVTQVAPSARSVDRGVAAPTTGFNFQGIIGSGSFPSDNNGSVGNDQYVETVNTRYQVWSLDRATNTPTSIVGPVGINTLFSGFTGGNCGTRNDGDPVVLFDKVANRWLISQFTSSPISGFYYQCVAISTTPNAAGTYFRYAFAVPNGNFGDYPHYGTWSDAYYVMAHGFTSAGGGSYTGGQFGAMDRAKMLAGDSTATWQVIIDPMEGGHMPADVDGFAPPPGGAPGIFASLHANGMYLYRMKVDFANPANTNRTLQSVVPIAPASAACGGGTCIPQPGSAVTLDSLADRLMFRLAYRNFIDHESLVVTHSVDPGISGVVSGVRWYDIRISGAPNSVCSQFPCTYQQGTIADAPNGRSRWMGSIAMDGAENIIAGYSASGTANVTDNHSVRYTSRAKNDPLGMMTGPETVIYTGTRNIGATRWGDYSSMSVDPADDCTLWYVNQYYDAGTTGSGSWRTRIASTRFPAGSGNGQCQATVCATRPTTAPGAPSVTLISDNKLQVNWVGITPAPGSYAIERAIGTPGSEGLYQPVASVPGTNTTFTDTTVQGGVTYTYRIIAASDAAGRCQALVRSPGASGTATGNCNLKPSFNGVGSASSANNSNCSVTITWAPANSSCPTNPNIRYNIYRGIVPDFVPAPANRIATCVPGPGSYVDTNNLVSGNTYYYVARAEDNTTGNGGPCSGGNEETNSVVTAGTAYGAGTQATPATWTDGGGDGTAFLTLNGDTTDQVWRFVKTSNDPGANHTPGGSYAYRTAGPGPNSIYASNLCAAAETPALTVGASTINLTYFERHQLEKGWDGVAVEFSVNGGAWTSVPAPSNSAGDGCMTTDVTTDWAALDCTGSPPVNACAYPPSTPVITGPVASGTSCNDWATGALTAYGRRCHFLTGLTPGNTIKFRWHFTSDPGSEFLGFYLDDIAITNIRQPNACNTVQAPAMTSAESRLTHGSAGTFGVNLPLSGRGIEPRRGTGAGATHGYTIVVHFDQQVTSGNASVNGNGAVGSVSFSGNDMIIPLMAVTDQQTLTLNLSNVTTPSGARLSATSLQIGFLIGDVNGDGYVQSADALVVRGASGSAVNGSNFRADVNPDGSIKSEDATIVRSSSGNSL